MKKIVIDFAPDGKSTVEAFGFSGKDCLSATKSIEEAIGKASADKPKPEMHRAVRATVRT
jgi:hypothetical protein